MRRKEEIEGKILNKGVADGLKQQNLKEQNPTKAKSSSHKEWYMQF